MTHTLANDLDYLAAVVHGRRSRMAKADRLDSLCPLRNFAEFAHAVFPESEPDSTAALQHYAVQRLIVELEALRGHLTGAQARLLTWLLVRFQLENLKVLLRGNMAGIPREELRGHLVTLPTSLALDAKNLAVADSLNSFTRLVPRGPLREALERALESEGESPRLFFLEAGLDHAYFEELVTSAGRLSGEDRDDVVALIHQEADSFHLMLVARGRFHYELKPAELLPLHVAGTRILRARFAAMLTDPDLATAMGRAEGLALDELPPEREGPEAISDDIASVEALAWKRFVRLAHRAFRQGHTGFGAIVGYLVLRRAEVANLITLSEGIRTHTAAEVLRARMIPRANLEASHV